MPIAKMCNFLTQLTEARSAVSLSMAFCMAEIWSITSGGRVVAFPSSPVHGRGAVSVQTHMLIHSHSDAVA